MDLLDDDDLLDTRRKRRSTEVEAVVHDLRSGVRALPEANEALRAFDTVGPGAERSAEATGPPPHGTCGVCRTRPARSTCKGCRTPVCAADTWVMFGLCRNCASDERMARWHRSGDVADVNWLQD